MRPKHNALNAAYLILIFDVSLCIYPQGRPTACPSYLPAVRVEYRKNHVNFAEKCSFMAKQLFRKLKNGSHGPECSTLQRFCVDISGFFRRSRAGTRLRPCLVPGGPQRPERSTLQHFEKAGCKVL